MLICPDGSGAHPDCRCVCLLLSSLATQSPEEASFWHWLIRVVPENGDKTVVVVCGASVVWCIMAKHLNGSRWFLVLGLTQRTTTLYQIGVKMLPTERETSPVVKAYIHRKFLALTMLWSAIPAVVVVVVVPSSRGPAYSGPIR